MKIENMVNWAETSEPMVVPQIHISVKRGEKIARAEQLELVEDKNIIN